MPELPEVEVSARIAAQALEGKVISHAELKPCKLFRTPRKKRRLERDHDIDEIELIDDCKRLSALLKGARAISPFTLRHGKLMALTLETADGGSLCLFARLGMTGKFLSRPDEAPPRASVKLSLRLKTADVGETDHYLDFTNTRMFGAIWGRYESLQVEPSKRAHSLRTLFNQERDLSSMGPDVLELCRDHQQWIEHLRTVANRRGIKSTLLDQSVIAGVGNIYAVEGLFTAKAHPLSRVHELTDQQLCALATGIESSMNQTLHDFSTEGDEIIYDSSRGHNSAFAVYGREGLPCPSCESSLAMIRLSGRATVYCPTCQAKG